jgi:AcrR family transcriptional regulator
MARRTAEEAAATRAQLVAVARDLFASEGYAATTLDGIGAAAGLTRGAVHHHFGDKRALFVEVFEALEHELNDAVVRAAIAAPPDPLEQMRAGCRALFKFFGRAEYRQIALADAPGVLGVLAWYDVDRSIGMATMRFGVQALAGAGYLDASQVGAVTVLLYGALTEAAINLQTPGSPHTADELIETVEAFLRGVSPSRGTRRSNGDDRGRRSRTRPR